MFLDTSRYSIAATQQLNRLSTQMHSSAWI